MGRLTYVAAVLTAGFVTVVLAGCGTTRIVTVAQSTAASSTTSSSGHNELTLGDTATLAGERSGERLGVTLLSYRSTITVGEYDTPDSGMKYVGVVLKIKNVGTAPYSDSPSNGATILTASGRQGKTTIIASGECSEGFASGVKIAPGESQEGCIPFELPQEDVAAKLQWTPASGFGEETAEWSISSGATAPAGGSGKSSVPNTAKQNTSASSAATPTLDALNGYWSDIAAHRFSGAYDYLVPDSVKMTESQFVASEQESHIESAQFRGHVESSSGSSATVEVVSLITRDKQYGCRKWSGSYEMSDEGGGWLIERANLSPQPCSA
ncbi:MAG TPA: DUF4352 domain-containing protein [Solirubrobacteraceae bacterium]|jgi:hypothetical protein